MEGEVSWVSGFLSFQVTKFPSFQGREKQWEAWNWSCDLRANERPKNNFTRWRKQTDRQTSRQTDMTTLWLNRPSEADSVKNIFLVTSISKFPWHNHYHPNHYTNHHSATTTIQYGLYSTVGYMLVTKTTKQTGKKLINILVLGVTLCYIIKKKVFLIKKNQRKNAKMQKYLWFMCQTVQEVTYSMEYKKSNKSAYAQPTNYN